MRITPACGTALTAGSGVTCRSPSAALSAMRRLSAGHPRGFFPSALFIYGVSYQSAAKFARKSRARLSRAPLKHFRLRASLPSLRSFPKKFCPLLRKRKRGGSSPGVLHEKSALHKRSAPSVNLFSRDKESFLRVTEGRDCPGGIRIAAGETGHMGCPAFATAPLPQRGLNRWRTENQPKRTSRSPSFSVSLEDSGRFFPIHMAYRKDCAGISGPQRVSRFPRPGRRIS